MFPQASPQHTDYQMPRTSPNYHLQQHQALLQQQLQVFHHFQAFQRHQFPNSPEAVAAAAAAAALASQQKRPTSNQHQLQQQHHQQQQLWPAHPPALPPSSSESEPSLSGASAPHSPIATSQSNILASAINSIADNDDDDSAGQSADRQISHYSTPLAPQHDNDAAPHRSSLQLPSTNKQRQHHQTSISKGHLEKPVRANSTKPKRVRTIFTPEQLKRLEYEFNNQMYLVGHDRCCLADSLNLSEAQVKVWFQNRRIKHRKMNPFV